MVVSVLFAAQLCIGWHLFRRIFWATTKSICTTAKLYALQSPTARPRQGTTSLGHRLLCMPGVQAHETLKPLVFFQTSIFMVIVRPGPLTCRSASRLRISKPWIGWTGQNSSRDLFSRPFSKSTAMF